MSFLVFQSDFGLEDGAVSAMVGVALKEDAHLQIHHISHEIPAFNIFEASYRLLQTVPYWPVGTVFVSVVDPGVGTNREAIAVRTTSNYIIVTPNNGTLTHLEQDHGIEEVRLIQTDDFISHTFHGRDVFAKAGAQLASGKRSFTEIGPLFEKEKLVRLALYQNIVESDLVQGSVDSLDVRFGSLWTSIRVEEFQELGIDFGESVMVTISNSQRMVYRQVLPFEVTFGKVPLGASVVYVNSMDRIGIAINQGSFSRAYGIGTGHQWEVCFKKPSNSI